MINRLILITNNEKFFLFFYKIKYVLKDYLP